jgi:hypothetical protein
MRNFDTAEGRVSQQCYRGLRTSSTAYHSLTEALQDPVMHPQVLSQERLSAPRRHSRAERRSSATATLTTFRTRVRMR